MKREKDHRSLTVRVPVDVKRDVERIAQALGISQSAVWKILIAQHVRPALASPLLDLRRSGNAESPERGPSLLPVDATLDGQMGGRAPARSQGLSEGP